MPSWPSCAAPPKVKADRSSGSTDGSRGGNRVPGCGCTAASVKTDDNKSGSRADPSPAAPELRSPVAPPTTTASTPDLSPATNPIDHTAATESPPTQVELDEDGESFFDAGSDAQSEDSWYDADGDASVMSEEEEGCDLGAPGAEVVDNEGSRFGDLSTRSVAGDPPEPEELLLHRAAFHGVVDEVTRLAEAEPSLLSAKDTHGNTPLHVAVIRGQKEVVTRLLLLGARVEMKNTRGWTAMEHAISLRDRPMVKLLYLHRVSEIKGEYKTKKRELMAALQGMPNYSLKMSWSLGSSVFGLLLRKYAPNDTYEVWKLGNCVRVDGTLMGIDDKSKGLIPEWKRGQFSLLFHGEYSAEGKSKTFLVSHTTGKWVDLSEQKKKAGDTSNKEVSLLMQDGAGKTKMKTTEMRFKPVKSLFGYPVREKVEGWNTTVYEAQARLVAVTTFKTPFELPEQCSFESYLAWEVAEDEVVERAVDPLSMDALKQSRGKGGRGGGGGAARRSFDSSSSAGGGGKKAARGVPRKVTSRCWMAEDFPMSLKQLLPLMDIIGHANKHLKKVASFMAKYGDRELFPVKIQAPLMLTVFALVRFRQFATLEAGEAALDPGFYEVPASYKKVSAEEMFGTSSMMGPKGGRRKEGHGAAAGQQQQRGSGEFEAADFDMFGDYEFSHS